MKKAFSEVIFSNSFKKEAKKLSKIEFKRLFSPESTEQAIEACNYVIKNPQTRKQAIVFIRAANGKKIRNTSGV